MVVSDSTFLLTNICQIRIENFTTEWNLREMRHKFPIPLCPVWRKGHRRTYNIFRLQIRYQKLLRYQIIAQP